MKLNLVALLALSLTACSSEEFSGSLDQRLAARPGGRLQVDLGREHPRARALSPPIDPWAMPQGQSLGRSPARGANEWPSPARPTS